MTTEPARQPLDLTEAALAAPPSRASKRRTAPKQEQQPQLPSEQDLIQRAMAGPHYQVTGEVTDPRIRHIQEYGRRMGWSDARIYEEARKYQQAVNPTGAVPLPRGGKYPLPGQSTALVGVTNQDVINAMLRDREGSIQAAKEQQAREQEGANLIRQALAGVGGSTQRASDFAAAEAPKIESAWRSQQSRLGEAMSFLSKLPGITEQKAQESVADISKRINDALDEFKNTTAQQLQLERVAINAEYENQREQILADARSRGLDPATDPQTKARLRQLDWQTRERFGNIAASLGNSYNQQRAALRQSYENLYADTRRFYDQLQQGTQLSSMQLYEQMNDAAMRSDQIRAQEQLSLETATQQILTLAEGLRLSGATTLADYLRDMTSFYAPLAPYIAEAFRMSEHARVQERAYNLELSQYRFPQYSAPRVSTFELKPR